MLREGRLTAGHARAFVTATNPESLARQVVDRDLSVRQTEALARAAAPNGAPRPVPRPAGKDADTRALEEDLTAALRLKVAIDHKPGAQSGEIRISYTSLEELDGLCQLLSR
jgi:ParB family chromosome partitioning protein